MPFVRGKTRRTDYAHDWRYIPPYTRTFYYLVENYREGGKVRQRTLAYLGKYPSVEEALAGLQNEIEHAYEQAAHFDEWYKKSPGTTYYRDVAQKYREKVPQIQAKLDRLQAVVATLAGGGG